MRDCYSHISVAKKLRRAPTGLTMPSGVATVFRKKGNRRRVDAAKKTQEIATSAKSYAPAFFKLVGLLAGSCALFFGTIEGARWLRTTPRLGLEHVTVTGHDEATDVELARLAGLALKQNLLAMDVPAMERAIAGHPWIRSVSIERRLPSSLTITVEEHRALALLASSELYLVNEEGEPFKRLKAGEPYDLPLITGLDREVFGDDRERALASLREAVAFIEAWKAHGALAAVPLSEVHLHPEGITAVMNDGLEAEFGEGGWPEKLTRLATVRRELHERALNAEVVRLDNRARPSWVAVKLAAKKP